MERPDNARSTLRIRVDVESNRVRGASLVTPGAVLV